MSTGINKAILVGNLGADGELRFTQGGSAVLNLRLATETEYKSGEEWQKRTEWHSVVVWGKRAEGLAKVIGKGDRLYVEGEIRTSEYEKDGQKRYKVQIHAKEVVLCGGGKRDGGSAGDDTSFPHGANAPEPRRDDRRQAPAAPAKGERPWERRS